MGSLWSGLGRRMAGLARTLFPILAGLTAFFSVFLFLAFFEAFDDYGGHGCTPPDQRCLSDLSTINLIEILTLVSFTVLSVGLALNRKRKGAAHLALMLVVLLLAAYTIPLLVQL